MNKIFGSIFAVTVPIWIFFISPTLLKLPSHMAFQVDVVSIDNFFDEKNKRFTGEIFSDTRFIYEAVAQDGDVLTISNTFDVRKPTGEKIFSVQRHYGIHSKTQAHIKGFGDRDREGYLFAPPGVNKEPFTYWHVNYDEPALMKFQAEEDILGLTVYRYRSNYNADQTKDLSHLPGVPTQRGVGLDIQLELWIEPISGALVKYEDKTTAFYYDIQTYERLHPWNQFHNRLSKRSIVEQVLRAKKARYKMYAIQYGIPLLLFFLAIGAIIPISPSKRQWFYIITILLMTSFAILYYPDQPEALSNRPIRVGILHSMSGTMAFSEKSVVEATLFAIDEINANGGLLGHAVETVVADGRSNSLVFAEEAERLIKEEKVSVVFGCWTSDSRKTVKPIIEKNNSLLFYPVQYEGVEFSHNIVYTGAAPNQQVIPAIRWAVDQGYRRFYLVGSDYIFPHIANQIIKDTVAHSGGEVIGESYIVLGSQSVDHVINQITTTKPDMIINTINGSSNFVFFKQLREHGIQSHQIPTLSFSITETELEKIGTEVALGDFAAWNYFQSINSSINLDFRSKHAKP